jgi:general L-amino acid transport system substrate-binding protein
VALLLALVHPAKGGVLERIRAEGVLRCGAAERAGFAEIDPEAGPRGVAVDLCRAVAVAVLGPSGRVVFSLYEAPGSYDGVRQGSDALAFLTGGEIAEQGLTGAVLPGPTVFVATTGVLVPESSAVRRLAELSGETVCLMIGSPAQRALERAAAAQGLALARLPFEEDVELLDAYNAGRCGAAVGEATYLAAMRATPGASRRGSRLLPETLSADAVVAATPQGDGAFAADIAWVVAALLLKDAPADGWSDASQALPAPLPPGFGAGWRAEVAAAVGSYSEIIRRHLEDRLGLAPGPNALWPAGLLLPPAVR